MRYLSLLDRTKFFLTIRAKSPTITNTKLGKIVKLKALQ